MVVKIIKELGADDTEKPGSTFIRQTMESNLDVCNVNGSILLELSKLDEFQLQDVNGNVIFQGEIRKPQNGDFNQYTGFDYGIQLGEIPVRKNYENKTPLEIIEDVITTYTELTYNNASVTTARTIPLYSTKNKYANEIIDDMHKILGTTHYVDKDKKFYIEYEGEELNTTVLTVGENCWVDSPGWTTDTDMICQGITVNGASKQTSESALFSGDGTTKTFVIAKAFSTMSVEYPIGTPLVPYIEGINTGDYIVNEEIPNIVLDVAPANATDNIQVNYNYDLQANFTIPGPAGNPHHKTINKEYLKEVTDCIAFANKYKARFENGIRECDIILDNLDITQYRANQSIKVVDNYHKIDGSYVSDTFIIKSVERSFGEDSASLKLTVGDSSSFVFDRDMETASKITDLNETVTAASLFNIGVQTLDNTKIEVGYTTTVTMKKATLPSDVLVSDNSMTATDTADLTNPSVTKYVAIDKSDYDALFVIVT